MKFFGYLRNGNALIVPMLNIACLTNRAIALIVPALLVGLGMAIPAHADEDESTQPVAPPLGICGLYYYSGLTVIDVNGQVSAVEDYCRNRTASQDVLIIPAVAGSRDDAFWQAFLLAANPTARQFAESVGRDKVVDYGNTICPFLQDGGTIDRLREVQSDSQTPASFEAAVTVAAINTHCPEYRSSIGR
jgi:hypothetical protein